MLEKWRFKSRGRSLKNIFSPLKKSGIFNAKICSNSRNLTKSSSVQYETLEKYTALEATFTQKCEIWT